METHAALLLSKIEVVEPSQPTIAVTGLGPAALSDDTLQTLRMAAEPRDQSGDEFRAWLRDCVVREMGRRSANDDAASVMPLEAECWLLPWHQWTDEELSAALAATYSWIECELGDEARETFIAIHQCVVTAACTRLSELDFAIKLAQKRKGK